MNGISQNFFSDEKLDRAIVETRRMIGAISTSGKGCLFFRQHLQNMEQERNNRLCLGTSLGLIQAAEEQRSEKTMKFVIRVNGRFAGQIKVGSKTRYAGTFDTEIEAHEAALDLKKKECGSVFC